VATCFDKFGRRKPCGQKDKPLPSPVMQQRRGPQRPKGMAKPIRNKKILFGNGKERYTPGAKRAIKPVVKPVRDPKILHGNGNERYTKSSGAPKSVLRAQNPKPKGGGGGGGAGGGGGGRRRPAGAGGGAGAGVGMFGPNVGGMIPTSLSSQGAALLTPGYADSLAGAQYDNQVSELNRQQSRTQQQGAQDLQDIGNWYGQVQAALDQARQRDQAATDAAGAHVDANTQALIQSLGGDANAGSGLVGAAGSDQAATLRDVGAAHTQYESDMAPLLAGESADARVRQQHTNSAQLADIGAQLANAQHDRGLAKSNAMYDISKYNNDIRDNRTNRLLQILNTNNALAQQRFGNRMSIESAQQAAALTGAKIQSMGLGKNSWKMMSPGDKSQIASDAYASVVDIDPETNQPTGHIKSGLTTQQAVKRVADMYRMYGLNPTNPKVRANALAVLRSLGLYPGQSWLRAPRKKHR